ncbi:hypothetical protein D3C80_2232310 [compost metagenome]
MVGTGQQLEALVGAGAGLVEQTHIGLRDGVVATMLDGQQRHSDRSGAGLAVGLRVIQ